MLLEVGTLASMEKVGSLQAWVPAALTLTIGIWAATSTHFALWIIFGALSVVQVAILVAGRDQDSKVGRVVQRGIGYVLIEFGLAWLGALLVIANRSDLRKEMIDPPQAFAFAFVMMGLPALIGGGCVVVEEKLRRK